LPIIPISPYYFLLFLFGGEALLTGARGYATYRKNVGAVWSLHPTLLGSKKNTHKHKLLDKEDSNI